MKVQRHMRRVILLVLEAICTIDSGSARKIFVGKSLAFNAFDTRVPRARLGLMFSRPISCIRLRGVRQNNLRNLDLDLPLGRLVVIAGLSGSGKSSLAFDTLFAEGQRRYIETFSPYARQFLDRMDKPQADSIEGIPPAIAIEQRNTVKSTRSTVGTMTEITDYAKMFWPNSRHSIAANAASRCKKTLRPAFGWRLGASLGPGKACSSPSIWP